MELNGMQSGITPSSPDNTDWLRSCSACVKSNQPTRPRGTRIPYQTNSPVKGLDVSQHIGMHKQVRAFDSWVAAATSSLRISPAGSRSAHASLNGSRCRNPRFCDEPPEPRCTKRKKKIHSSFLVSAEVETLTQ